MMLPKIVLLAFVGVAPAIHQTAPKANSTTSTPLGPPTWLIDERAGRDFAKADAKMNLILQEIKQLLDDEESWKILEKAQSLWIQYRDVSAEYESAWCEGGTAHSAVMTNSKTELTRSRITQLKKYRDNLKAIDKILSPPG